MATLTPDMGTLSPEAAAAAAAAAAAQLQFALTQVAEPVVRPRPLLSRFELTVK